MEISKAPEAPEAKVELTEQQIREQQAMYEHQQQQMLKERKRRLKVLKEDVEWMETNYKYMQLRMALPELEQKYNKLLQAEEAAYAQHQAVKESMDNDEGPVIEDKVEEAPKQEGTE